MIVSKLEQELYELCCKEWREQPKADPANIYHRALKEIERLRCNAHWAEGTPADFPLASPRPWGLYESDTANTGLQLVTETGELILAYGPRAGLAERWDANMQLIVRAVNNWKA